MTTAASFNTADLVRVSVNALERELPRERIAWALNTFPREEILITSSFGIDSAVLLHLIHAIDPSLPIGFVDTGFLFPETHLYKDRLARLLGLDIETYLAPSPADPAQEHVARACGEGPIWCACRKVEAMERALEGKTCWITGVRRGSSASRAATPVLETQGDGLVKLYPIVDWTPECMLNYLREYRLPPHPLARQGYSSVGCMSCTRLPLPGEGARSGRWLGVDRDECGIHSFQPKRGDRSARTDVTNDANPAAEALL